MLISKRLMVTAAIAAAFGTWPLAGQAADKFPSKIVRIIIPTPPGGSNDVLMRPIATKLQEIWKQPVILEYKPGANQIIGADFAAKSAPDGHTIGIVLVSHVMNVVLRSKLPYDLLEDFAGVMLIGFQPLIITTVTDNPYSSVGDMLAAARKAPGSISYATTGMGSPMHFAGESIARSAKVELNHVPFKGGAQAVQEVMSGRVTMNISTLSTALPFMQQGRLRPLAVLEPKRIEAMPDVPALAEVVPGLAIRSFVGLVVPKATPRDVIQQINEGLKTVLKSPEIRAALNRQSMEIVASNPEVLDQLLKDEVAHWSVLVKKTGITVE